ncbi:MAG: haloacid dehalogenase type II [Chloroflexaceae bacterium]|nr:haloacid dehalogenase type II [Chloroflexaceae bacterium]NJO04267.1 haloacid dehalogenase type II [Chloroflexaceae bacterium]
MARVCVFDVNETLLDLRALEPHFVRIFGNAAVLHTWFGTMLQQAMISTITGAYTDFGKLGGAALAITAERFGVAISDEDRQQIVSGIRTLPPHPEVRESLEKLRDAGLRLAALTNSTEQVAQAQLTNAGLADLFEQILSADMVQRLKPAPEPYHMAAEKLGVGIADIRLIAAHDWDIAGIMRAGGAGAFVARPGMILSPLTPTPDVIGADMRKVVEQIIAIEVQ